MDAIPDFEDLLKLLHKHDVRYLVIGGLAFIYHARPRYTKDMDLWIAPSPRNVERANRALAEFGSPHLLAVGEPEEILQIGLPPNRIGLFRVIDGPAFDSAWRRRITGKYGRAKVNWMDLGASSTSRRASRIPVTAGTSEISRRCAQRGRAPPGRGILPPARGVPGDARAERLHVSADSHKRLGQRRLRTVTSLSGRPAASRRGSAHPVVAAICAVAKALRERIV